MKQNGEYNRGWGRRGTAVRIGALLLLVLGCVCTDREMADTRLAGNRR